MEAIQEQALRAEEMRRLALCSNDANALGALLSDRLVFVHSSGTRDERQTLLLKISSGAIRYLEVEFSQMQTQPLLGEQHVLVTGVMRARIMVAGEVRAICSRYLAVWCTECDGSLRMVAHQGTALPVD